MKMTYSEQLCNQSCVCLASTLSAYISIAPEQGRAGVSGAEWVTEGLMLALSEPSPPREKLFRHNKNLLKHEIALLTFL